MIGAAAAFFAFIVFVLWPRPFQPPLKGMGEPVWEGDFGTSYRYIYSFPEAYSMYFQTAANHLKFKGYTNKGYRIFRHPDGSVVFIYPGKWRRGPSSDGMIDTYYPGWVTVSCSLPPDSLKRFWADLKRRFSRERIPPRVVRTP